MVGLQAWTVTARTSAEPIVLGRLASTAKLVSEARDVQEAPDPNEPLKAWVR